MARNDGFIELITREELNKLAAGEKGIDKLVQGVNNFNNTAKGLKLPSEFKNQITEINNLIRTSNELITAQIALQNRLSQSTTNSTNATNAESRARGTRNTRTQEEITNTRLLAANASRAAQANSTFANSYERLSAQQNIAARNVQNLIARGRTAEQTQRQYNRELALAQRQFEALNSRVIAADRAVGRFNRNVGNYPMQAARGLKDLLMAFGVVGGVTAFAAITKDIFNTTRELQGLDFALKQVLGSNEAFGQSQQFLQRISESYGIEIKGLTRSYTGFFAASKNAIESGAITAQQIQDIFESVSKASGAMGLSVDQQQGAFLALQQMISKGNVQAEEIRGQLAERLPGAFGILAKSMGVTEIELNKLLKDGKVLAAEVLPAFARELERAYGVENLQRVESLTAETTRLGNAWTDLIREISEGDSIVTKSLVGFISYLKTAAQGVKELAQSEDDRRDDQLKGIQESSYNAELDLLKQLNQENKELAKFAANDRIKENPGFLKELRDERDALNEQIEAQERIIDIAQEKGGWALLTPQVRSAKEELERLNNEYDRSLNTTQTTLGQLRAASEFLKKPIPNQAKQDAGKAKRQKQDIDYLKEVYNLQKQNTENLIADDEQIMNNEEVNYAKRLEAANNYFFQREHLLELDYNEQKRLSDLEYKNQVESYKLAISEGKATQSNLEELEYQHILRKKKNDEKYEYDKSKLSVESAKKLQGVLLDIEEQRTKNNANRLKLGDTKEETNLLQSVSGMTSIKEFTVLENKLRDIAAANEDRAIDILNAELKTNLAKQQSIILSGGSIANNQALLKLQDEQISKLQSIADIEKQRAESVAQLYNEMKTATTDYLNSITSSVFNDAGLGNLGKFFDQVSYDVIEKVNGIDTVVQKTGSTFEKMFDQASTTAEKTAVAFQTMTSVISEAFNFLQQNRQAGFDKELADAQKLYDIRKKYAGDSTEAQAELEQELEDKKRAIRIKEAKAAKETAIFNIGINTAQAVVAALASVPPNIPLSIAIGAIGLAQGIAVASRPLPAYKDGTQNHIGGLAVVGDGGKHEVVWQPKGGYSITPNTDTIMNLQKGSKVYPDIASSGLLGSGLPNINIPKGGISESELDRVMERHLSKIVSQEIVLDERGFRSHQRKANAETVNHSNRTSHKGYVIKG